MPGGSLPIISGRFSRIPSILWLKTTVRPLSREAAGMMRPGDDRVMEFPIETAGLDSTSLTGNGIPDGPYPEKDSP